MLVRWSTLSSESATWEDYEVIKKRFPDAPAWGPAGSQGEGNVSMQLLSLGVKQATQSIQARKRAEVRREI